jgi:hypothetical protein
MRKIWQASFQERLSMFRFTIRELLLLTALVGAVIGWRTDVWARDLSHRATRSHAERLRESLADAKGINGMLLRAIEHPNEPQCWQVSYPNWALVSQPIP